MSRLITCELGYEGPCGPQIIFLDREVPDGVPLDDALNDLTKEAIQKLHHATGNPLAGFPEWFKKFCSFLESRYGWNENDIGSLKETDYEEEFIRGLTPEQAAKECFS